jgi:hypothetical protein
LDNNLIRNKNEDFEKYSAPVRGYTAASIQIIPAASVRF